MGSHFRLAGRKLITLLLMLAANNASAGLADVLKAEIERNPDGTFAIAVTVRHADTGWGHYANRWEVLGPQGQVIATRTLLHPHVNEQPFTRGLHAVSIPYNATWVKVRAHDSKHGDGGREVTLSVPH